MSDRTEIAERKAWLKMYGFKYGERDPLMNTAFNGRFMVAKHYLDGHTQESSRGGVWCVVGDNLDALIDAAYNAFADEERSCG